MFNSSLAIGLPGYSLLPLGAHHFKVVLCLSSSKTHKPLHGVLQI